MSAIVFSVVSALGGAVGLEIYRRRVSANPNEWLLLISADGALKQCGVGISVFRGLNDTVVRFPSLLNKVEFSAQQVTEEMQGVELKGFVIWVINREGDGPLKAYRHIPNLDAALTHDAEVNQNIRSMAASIVRAQVANLSIKDVIAKRKHVRDLIRTEMQAILNGWGIWLETAEITEVTVLSNSVFSDMQTEFRERTRYDAERLRMETRQSIETERIGKEHELSINRTEREKEMSIYKSQTQIEKKIQENKLLEQTQILKRQAIQMQHETEMLELQVAQTKADSEFEQKAKEAERKLEMDKRAWEQSIEMKQRENELDSQMPPAQMQKLTLETIEKIYSKLRVDSLRIVNMGPNQGVETAVPQFAAAFREAYKQVTGAIEN